MSEWFKKYGEIIHSNSQNPAVIEKTGGSNWFEKYGEIVTPSAKAVDPEDIDIMGRRANPTIMGVLKNEGGFQNDADDRGNYFNGQLIGTNYGITPATLAEYRGVSDVTRDDIVNLTQDEAYDIYEKMYVKDPGFDQLPDGVLKDSLIDMGVNAGPVRAVRLLQRVAGVKEDGVLGPKTIGALGNVTATQYADARINYYTNLAEANPVYQKFLGGWTNRANKYRADETLDIQVAGNDQ